MLNQLDGFTQDDNIKARPPAHARSTAPTPHRPSSDNLTLSFHVHA